MLKEITFSHVVENKSRYPIDSVWENAQDLEHVGFLHRQTNKSFNLLHTEKFPGSPNVYDVMVYRTTRRFFGFGLTTVGFRRIAGPHNIHQVEYIPLFKVTSALNSLLYSTDDPEFPTLMRDEVVMKAPFYFAPLKAYLGRALKRHTRLQCQEDEPFRERRVELKRRGISLPYRVFFRSVYQELSAFFKHRIGSSET